VLKDLTICGETGLVPVINSLSTESGIVIEGELDTNSSTSTQNRTIYTGESAGEIKYCRSHSPKENTLAHRPVM
jgi:hypothetical protein